MQPNATLHITALLTWSPIMVRNIPVHILASSLVSGNFSTLPVHHCIAEATEKLSQQSKSQSLEGQGPPFQHQALLKPEVTDGMYENIKRKRQQAKAAYCMTSIQNHCPSSM